jgi:hypothetical protein
MFKKGRLHYYNLSAWKPSIFYFVLEKLMQSKNITHPNLFNPGCSTFEGCGNIAAPEASTSVDSDTEVIL